MKSIAHTIKKSLLSKRTWVYGSFVSILTMAVACESFVKIDPPKTQLINTVVFQSDATATSALTGIYSKMMEALAGSFANYKVNLCGGLSSDELKDYSNNVTQAGFYTNSLLANNSNVQSLWNDAFLYIYMANSVVEGLAGSTGVTPAVHQQLEGEAKFIRAFCHFYLTNLFGDIPYIKTTDYTANASVGRSPQLEVYQKIIADLIDAQTLLSDTYISTEKVRPNKSTATALLARAYLYTQDWANAVTQASAVIGAGYTLSPLSGVFLKNSSEAIWQLMPEVSGYNTFEGNWFVLSSTAAPTNVTASDSLFNAFKPGDNRKTSWLANVTVAGKTYYFPNKYKVKTGTTVSEYYMMFRLAEQYLIRAEALAQQNSIAQAVADLNTIRVRTGLVPFPTTLSQAQCLAAVEQERRIELFCEWGHRWFDLKRTNRADAVLSVSKPGWQTTDALFPIPQTQLTNDQNMAQNPGY
ncbi:membrane protein [Cytophagales bacterium WSM2-2]|nr:membrane protein [Cytophagales bacterium WSM2-2]